MSAPVSNKLQKLLPLLSQLMRFGLVGGLAAATHFGVALCASQFMHLLLANCLGFVVAFWVSFFGHYYVSFQVKQTLTLQSAGKFGVVAVTGFLLNQLIVASLEHFSHWQDADILLTAIVITALVTFLLSRFYAFR